MRKILISDYYSASNRGDAAILEGELNALSTEFPDAKIQVLSEDPEAAKVVHGREVVQQPLVPMDASLTKNLLRVVLILFAPLLAKHNSLPLLHHLLDDTPIDVYLEADLFVSTGGHYITDIYMPSKLAVLWEFYFVHRLSVPVVLYAQSIGPVQKYPYRPLVKWVLNRATLISTRDRQSKQNLEELGIQTRVEYTADAAFAMDTVGREGKSILEGRETEVTDTNSDTIVTISVRSWKHYDESENQLQYETAVASLADWLIAEQDAHVLFASTCTGLNGYHRDDRVYAMKIIEMMDPSNVENASVLWGEYTPHQLVEIYESSDVHVGTRMHSNILALLAGTPVVMIKYQFKTEGLVDQFNLEEYCIDIDDVETESLRQVVKNAFENRDTMCDRIETRLPEIRRHSMETASHVSSAIDQ